MTQTTTQVMQFHRLTPSKSGRGPVPEEKDFVRKRGTLDRRTAMVISPEGSTPPMLSEPLRRSLEPGVRHCMTAEDQAQPLLRTLAPLLRQLERQVRSWLDARRRYPLTMMQRAELEGL